MLLSTIFQLYHGSPFYSRKTCKRAVVFSFSLHFEVEVQFKKEEDRKVSESSPSRGYGGSI
jgi:hypothetical protein